ncbi:MAG: hypothetical protein ACK58T_12990, partial [Phycisphaerae bacterium]
MVSIDHCPEIVGKCLSAHQADQNSDGHSCDPMQVHPVHHATDRHVFVHQSLSRPLVSAIRRCWQVHIP